MGIVVDEKKARNSICYCKTYEMKGKTRTLCWSPGVIGVLSEKDGQMVDFCPIELRRPLPQKIDTTELKDLLFGTNRDAEKLIG